MMFTIGQLAARTGATPRALRLYERRGLLRADRTASGRRVFGAEHVILLSQIRMLKSMGLSLDSIAGILRARTLDAGALIELRLASIEAEQARLAALAAQLHAARTAIASGPVDAARLCELLSEAAPADFRQLLDRWFTPSEQRAWRDALGNSGPGSSWDQLLARVQAAMAAGVSPASPEGAALAADWQALMHRMADAVGAQQWNRGAALARQVFSAAKAGPGSEQAAIHAWLAAAVPPHHPEEGQAAERG